MQEAGTGGWETQSRGVTDVREDSLRKTENNDERFSVRLWREHELALPNEMEFSGTGVKYEVAFAVRVMS